MRFGPCDEVVYLDTGTGVPENRDYVRDLCDRFGWSFRAMETPESYEELVLEHGFPGPSRHFIMYQRLKERQLCTLAAETNGYLHLWTGIRRFESDRRMRHVEPETERGNGRWYWRAPLCEWIDREPAEYIETFDLPENPLWDTLGRSGDCFCGCYGSPEELIDLRAVGADDLADDLRSLEEQARDAGHTDEKFRWAWGGMTDAEQRAERAEGRDMTLCSACGGGYPTATDGGQNGSQAGDGDG
jgi:3'-phosphoadenosine 5'-phosphosulfate sulfotransferase (PAPS reductase)/FAD synthetase